MLSRNQQHMMIVENRLKKHSKNVANQIKSDVNHINTSILAAVKQLSETNEKLIEIARQYLNPSIALFAYQKQMFFDAVIQEIIEHDELVDKVEKSTFPEKNEFLEGIFEDMKKSGLSFRKLITDDFNMLKKIREGDFKQEFLFVKEVLQCKKPQRLERFVDEGSSLKFAHYHAMMRLKRIIIPREILQQGEESVDRFIKKR